MWEESLADAELERMHLLKKLCPSKKLHLPKKSYLPKGCAR